MLQNYQKHKQERQEQGLPPLPLDASQNKELVKIFENGVADEFCLDLLINQFLLELMNQHMLRQLS